MSPPDPNFSVLIPHHSRRDWLLRCLSAVEGWPVLVVDDGPEPMTEVAVECLRTPGDTGYAAAVNLGLRQLELQGVQRVLVLNDDAIVEQGCIAALLAEWTEKDGALGPVLMDDSSRTFHGIHVGWSGRVRVNRQPQAAGSVDALSGACMLIRASERFDARYVHGFEDIELCRRLQRRSLGVRVVPQAVCLHQGGATIDQRSRLAQRSALSGHLRYLGPGWRQAFAVTLGIGQVVRQKGPWDRFLGVFDACRDYWGDGSFSLGASASEPVVRAAVMASPRPGSSKIK